MNNEFLGCGFTRKVFDLGNGTVRKVALEEDIENGISQNRNEYENHVRANEHGLKCFVEVISHNDDFTEIIVRKAEKTNKYNATSQFVLESYLRGVTLSKNNLDYLDEYYQNKYIPLFFFGLDEFLGIYDKTYSNYDVTDLENLKTFCKKSYSVQLNRYSSYYNIAPKYEWVSSLVYEILEDKENTTALSLKDLILYGVMYNTIVLADLWNSTQWGFIDDRLTVIDSGYSPDIQCKQSRNNTFKILPRMLVSKINSPNEDIKHFNGKLIDEIKSPKGNKVTHKFFTSKGSEYILASDGMARRIKNAGLNDDGLWSWTSKTYFVDYDELTHMMDEYPKISKNLRPIKVDYDNGELSLSSINDSGDWENVIKLNNVSETPIIGKHTLEFVYTGKNIIKKYHPGHDVNVIEF